MPATNSRIPEVLSGNENEILSAWTVELAESVGSATGAISSAEIREQCGEFLRLLTRATASGNLTDPNGPEWSGVREMLASVSRSRSLQGFSPSDTALFVLSLKRPLFKHLRAGTNDAEQLFGDVWAATMLLDRLALFTTEVHQRSREEVIARQQQDMLELSTPVVKLWEGILALPMIGTLDSARTQVVMETLLQRIVETGASIAIIDITGVPTVDTLVAQHLLKTVTAARLMGADCIISGIRPQIAQTIVHLGVDLNEVSTKATLADAFLLALKRNGASLDKFSRVG